MGGNFDGSGVTNVHAIWGAAGVVVATIVRANGWHVPGDGPEAGWQVRKALSDASSALAIYCITLGLTAWLDLEAAVTCALATILTVIGLTPISIAMQGAMETWIKRKAEK